MLGSRVRAPAGSPDKISDNHTIIGDFFVLWYISFCSGTFPNSEPFSFLRGEIFLHLYFIFHIFCVRSEQVEKFLLSLSLHTELWATARRKKWKGNRVKIPNNACCCEFYFSCEKLRLIALFATGENWEGAIGGTSQKTCLCIRGFYACRTTGKNQDNVLAVVPILRCPLSLLSLPYYIYVREMFVVISRPKSQFWVLNKLFQSCRILLGIARRIRLYFFV